MVMCMITENSMMEAHNIFLWLQKELGKDGIEALYKLSGVTCGYEMVKIIQKDIESGANKVRWVK